MKILIDAINYESDQTNFQVKLKCGPTVLQTVLGNNWNHRFVLEHKKATEIRIEVWQKPNDEFQFIGDAIIQRVEGSQKLTIKQNNKEQGFINVQYKEVKDSVTQQILSQDSLNLSKIEKQAQALQKLNDSLSMIPSPHQDFGSINEYFSQQFQNEDIIGNSKKVATKLVGESLDKILQNVSIGKEVHLQDDDDFVENEVEKNNIEKLQKQLMKIDCNKLEKKRKQISSEIFQLDEMTQQLRIDQIEQKQQIQNLRQDLIQKLLYLEDKIEHLKKQIRKQKHHVFGSNPNLVNSEIEISSINLQKQFVEKWQQDPNLEKQRQEFISKQIQEWNDIQIQRKKRIDEQFKKIEQEEKIILQKKNELQQTTNAKKREEIEKNLKLLEEQQAKRKVELEEANRRFEKKKKEKYLALRYAEQDATYMIQLQQERKKILAQNKNPEFDAKEIKQFEDKFNQIHIEKQKKRRVQWDEREAQWNKFKAQYYSASYQKAKEEYKRIENGIEQEKQERLNKLTQFIQEVKQNHKPTISEDLQDKLILMKNNIKHQSDYKKYQSLSKIIQSKHQYHGVSKEKLQKIVKKQKLIPLEKLPINKISPRDVGDFYLKQNATFNIKNIPPVKRLQKNDNEAKQSVSSLPNPKQFDYLKHQRQKKAQKILQNGSLDNNILDKEDLQMLDSINKKLLALK
ncbi:unnamed protein product [Paramecium octaurelia]|uniref:C2 domain-containing protein n=1 Tax=Paramecium octaurelia TaxID=43137 RepID=A0A8S1XA72_PAROT|nr:unnamed protein product [Paramecium octaurelia]